MHASSPRRKSVCIAVAAILPYSSGFPYPVSRTTGETQLEDSAEVVGRVASACAEAEQWQTVLHLLDVLWRQRAWTSPGRCHVGRSMLVQIDVAMRCSKPFTW